MRDDSRGTACAKGIRSAPDAELGEEDLGLLLASSVGYHVEQSCSFKLEGRLMLMDNEPGLLLSRLNTHRSERVLGPPPLLLRTHEASYIVHRRREPGAHERVDCYPGLARAVVAWVRHMVDKRGGVLFLDRKIGSFAPVFLGRVAPTDATIQLGTVALV